MFEAMGPPPMIQNRYRLVQQLGRGGMGLVFRARDEMLDRDVAIKFLDPSKMHDPQANLRFTREAKSLAQLSHPNIMAIFDAGEESNWHYLILELLTGENLHALRMKENGRFPIPTTLTITRQLLAALVYTHERGIIHRDLKPENVMVDKSGRVKLADFGMARLQDQARITQEQAMLGTILYLAPECIAGQEADHRSDLYGLGGILYEMLTGRPPFTSNSPTELMVEVLNQPAISPIQFNDKISSELERLVMTLLEKEPSRRFQSASDVLAALPGESESDSHSASDKQAQKQTETLIEQFMRLSSSVEAVQQPGIVPDLLMFAASEDTAVSIENERRRLAQKLQTQISDSLNLLLSQTQLYESSAAADPASRMAFSVLTTLVRQVVQQVNDLEAELYPEVLDNLGLEPALEALVSREIRTYGIAIQLHSPRLPQRLPAPIETALYRLTQETLRYAVTTRKATQITIQLRIDKTNVRYHFEDNGLIALEIDQFGTALERIKQLGGEFEINSSQNGALELAVQFGPQNQVQFTEREQDVLKLIVAGMTNKEVAQRLDISPRTVNFHLDNIYSKLGVNSRTEAAVFALRLGIIKP